ncbi:MAG: membrane protein [Pirellulaceae bacterium]|nr:MAG: membrane protein [Pirellulaceae bacterium]
MTVSPVFDSYLVVAVAAAGLFALLALRPSFGKLTFRQRLVLVSLRASVSLLLVLALLRPAWVFTSTLQQPAALIVLFDTSQSMELPSGREQWTRWQAQRQLLEQLFSQVRNLGAGWDVQVYGYDRKLHPVDISQGAAALPESPQGRETDIGACLEEAVRRAMGKRIGAVVLLGDGVVTAYDPKVDVHDAARQLARMGVPLFAVAFGQAGDTSQLRDVAVENLPEQYTAFVKNELLVRGILRVAGFANRPIPVELAVTHPDGKEEVIGPKEILVDSETRLLPIELSFVPQQPGQYKLALRVPAQPGEINTSNNMLSSFLTVLEGGIRVLYVYGSLTGEQRYLRWSLGSSPDIHLEHLFIDPRNRANWPDPRGDLFGQQRFDVVLLENVHSQAMRTEVWQVLARWVEQGTGLMMIGGYHSFGPGGFADTPLRDVLPIELDRLERQDPSPLAPWRPDTHWNPPEGIVMLPAMPHPVVRLAPETQNEQVWRRLPPLLGANRFSKLKPAARVLAAGPNDEPLLVAQEYGRGRVLAFAGDSTYRWWQHGHQQEHKRFWRQAILWLAHRDEDPRSEVWIKLAQRRFPPQVPIELTAGVRSPTGDPESDAQLEMLLYTVDGQQRSIELRQQEDHWSGTVEGLELPGDYRLEATARRAGQVIGKTELTFQVLDTDIERSVLAADPDQLARMAHITRDVGGQLVAPEQLAQIIESLKERRPEETLSMQRRWRLGDTPWDAAALFLVIVGCWSGEWFLRRKWGLV